MKYPINKILITISGLFIYILLATGTSQCDRPTRMLEFVGNVKDFTNKPINNRLVIIYLNGKEIGRAQTKLGKFKRISRLKKPNDGLFVARVKNSYELTRKELGEDGTGRVSTFSSAGELKLGSRLFLDIGEFSENQEKSFSIKNRNNVTYTIKVIPGDYATLPQDIKDNKTMLSKGKVVVVTTEGDVAVNVKNVIFSDQLEYNKLKEYEFPLSNCAGSSDLVQEYKKSESFIHETSFNLGLDAKTTRFPFLWMRGIDLSTFFQAKYGFIDKQVSEELISTTFTAKPKTSVTYKIIWSEIWQLGEAEVESPEGIKMVPFKVKTGLKYEIKTEKTSCR